MIEQFLFLFTGIIGVVTLVLIITSYKSNPFYNAFLLLIIIIVSFRFLVHGSFGLGLQTLLSPDQKLPSVFYLIIAPCFYLYHKNLVFQSKAFNITDLKHVIFLVFLYTINSNTYLAQSFIFHYGSLTNFGLVVIFLLFYLTLIYRVLSKNIWFKKDLLINNRHFKLVKSWTIYLFTLNVLMGITLMVSIYNEVNTQVGLSGKSMAMFLLVFWLFIFFKILTTPEILYGLPILNKKILKFNLPEEENNLIEKPINDNWVLETSSQKNYQDLKLQEKINSNILSYTQGVDKLSNEGLIFRNPKASALDVANKLGLPTSHIVYLFKYHSNISFSEYRMQSRIQDSINLIKIDYLKTNTLESLAYKTGFASYNPFFSAFKKVTTLSPQDYVKS
ncbi:Helix-turn-helix domain-containing protein [Flaviramulus basaltis]|uniref:Helix-turn-helix domain-containing protein n=1 Tax=Flaviramulus basaltis TaxID=369401 RepID=A0A1K2ILB1_9FLAO|nr:AraC family transcriptional regulator [Flaviramulus basaltis]SFZ93253.1 Helix-turn-helix domain-containing protein [Flaviramulus basaltis]